MFTILVADDEEPLRNLLCRLLERNGYAALPALDGPDALRIASEYPGPIDLLLADVRMPGMQGPELYRCLESQRPGLRVLFMSGYVGSRIGDAPFLRKPFTPDVLLQNVRALLHSAGPQADPPVPPASGFAQALGR